MYTGAIGINLDKIKTHYIAIFSFIVSPAPTSHPLPFPLPLLRYNCCVFNLRSAAVPARASTNKAPSPAQLSPTHAKSTHPRDKASNFIVISFVRSLMMYCCIAGRRERAPIEDPSRRYAGGRYCTPVRRISKKAGA